MRIVNPASSLLAFCLACMGAAAVASCPACKQAQSDTIDSAYAAKQLACVQDAGSRAESDACRRAVDAQFGVTTTVSAKDGGK